MKRSVAMVSIVWFMACGKDLDSLHLGTPSDLVDAAGADAAGADARADAAMTDAPGGDASPDGSNGSCGGVVCEDFEATAVGGIPGAPWTVSRPNCSGSGTLSVDASQAHGGTHSLKVVGGPNFCDHVFLASTAPATLHPTLYARFFVRFDDAFGPSHTTFLAMADTADGTGGATKDMRMGGQSGIFMWNREKTDATLPALSPVGIAQSVVPTPDAWHCVQIAIDSAARTLQTSIDGVARAGLAIDTTPTQDLDQQWLSSAWMPNLQDIRFGWEAYGGTAMTLWYDDIAIGSAPIGCP